MTRKDNAIKTQVENALRDWQTRFSEKFDIELGITLDYNLRGCTTGGVAILKKNTIKINLDWVRENPIEYFNDTVPHEIAHHVAYRVYRDAGHGRYWKHVMRTMGLTPDRTTSAFSNVKPARKVRRFLYVLPCGCEYKLTAMRHNKIMGGYAKYSCKPHRTYITPAHCKGEVLDPK